MRTLLVMMAAWLCAAAGSAPPVNQDLGCSTGQAVIYNGSAVQCGAVDLTTSTGALPAAQLPVPSASTLGGVQSSATASHNFLTGVSTSGVPSKAQPACADLSDAAASCNTNTTIATNINTGTLPVAQLPKINGYHSFTVASGANTITLADDTAPGTVSHVITANAGETSLAMKMPANPGPDGQILCLTNAITNTGITTSVTLAANTGQSLGGTGITQIGGTTTTNGSWRFCWQWLLGTTTWQRIQ